MAFSDDNRLQGMPKCTMLEIDLTDTYTKRAAVYQASPTNFSTATLYLCDAGDGSKGPMLFSSTNCYPLLKSHQVRGMTSGFGSQAADADAMFVLHNRKYPWQQQMEVSAEGRETSENEVKLGQLLHQYRWQGAVVRAYTVTLPHSGGTASRSLMFTGLIDAVEDIGEESFTLQCVFDKTYNKTFPDADTPSGGSGSSLITIKDWPDAPKSSVNRTIPMVWAGDTTAAYNPASPSDANYISPNLLMGLAPMAMTSAKYDSGDNTAATLFSNKFPAAGTSAYTPTVFMWVPDANAMASITPASQVIDTREAYFKIDASPTATLPLNPSLFGKTYGTVTNPRYGFDGNVQTRAAILGATGRLLCQVPDITPQGRITQIKAFVYLGAGTGVNTGAGGSSVNGTVSIYDDTASADVFACTANLTKNNLDNGGLIKSTAMNATGLGDADISKWSWQTGGHQLYASVYCSTALATANVIAFGFEIKYVPYNITRDVHQKQRVPIYDVQGRLKGYRWV